MRKIIGILKMVSDWTDFVLLEVVVEDRFFFENNNGQLYEKIYDYQYNSFI